MFPSETAPIDTVCHLNSFDYGLDTFGVLLTSSVGYCNPTILEETPFTGITL